MRDRAGRARRGSTPTSKATPTTLLDELESLRESFRNGASARKLELLQRLEPLTLGRATSVARLHELLCFMRAYPDDAAVLAQVERMLAAFGEREDVRRHRSRLEDSGIAGSDIVFEFYWPTAKWLAKRWPSQLIIDWPEFEHADRIDELLPLLLPDAESFALDQVDLSAKQWLARLRGPSETDASFLIQRFARLSVDAAMREKLYDDLSVPVRLTSGPGTPSRTHAKFGRRKIVFQDSPRPRSRPSLRRELARAPLSVREVSPRVGRKLIDLAHEAMVTRSRDLYAIAAASHHDVRMIDDGGGLELACIGVVPERRFTLETLYVFLALHNGVPIAYVQACVMFGEVDVNFNVFEPFRGAGASHAYARCLAAIHHMFRPHTFVVDHQQLGEGNREALTSGAWWFYYKLGFRPRSPQVRRIVKAELAHMKSDPTHRSPIATLKRLAADQLYFRVTRAPHGDPKPMAVEQLGLRVTRHLAESHGSDREGGIRSCAREVAGLLGLDDLRSLSKGERLAWERWAPLVMALPGVSSWSPASRRELAELIRAKGGRQESRYHELASKHEPLRRALAGLGRLRS